MEIVVPLGDPTEVTIFSKKLYSHAIKQTTAAKLMAVGLSADSANNPVQYFDELTKGPGSQIKYDLVPNIIGPGVLGDAVIAGQEQAFAALQDSFVINQQRQSELWKGQMSQQRVPYSARDALKTTLANWWKVTLDVGLMNQLCGNTAQGNVAYTGLNAAIAPDTAHWMYALTASSEATLTSSMPFTLDLVTKAKAKARAGVAFPIKPLTIKGVQVAGVMFLHPWQVRDLRNTYSAGAWGAIQTAAMTGGKITGNPIFTGAIGMFDDVILHEEPYAPWGDNAQNTIYDPVSQTMVAGPSSLGAAATGTTSVARAVFVGAQAAAFACGGNAGPDGKPLRVRWVEELLDAQNQLRVTAGMIYGIKKSRFASQDYATIVVSSWASAS